MDNPAILEYIEEIKGSRLESNIKDVIICLLETSTDENKGFVFGKISRILHENVVVETYLLSLLKKNEAILAKLHDRMKGSSNSGNSTYNEETMFPNPAVVSNNGLSSTVENQTSLEAPQESAQIMPSLEEKKKLSEEEDKKKIEALMAQLATLTVTTNGNPSIVNNPTPI